MSNSNDANIWTKDPDAAFREASDRVAALGKTLLTSHVLDLSDLRALERLPTMNGAEDLQSLTLDNTRIVDLGPIRGAPKLSNLSFRRTPVSDITQLAELALLEKVDASHSNVEDLASLASCKKLSSIDLWDTKVSSIESLAQLQELESLTLWDTTVSDLSPITGLPKLKWLDLENTSVTDANPIVSLPVLDVLYISGTKFADYLWLSKLHELVGLGISRTKISGLDMISELTKLEWIIAAKCNIGDLSTLSHLTNLKRLEINGNPVSDISPIRLLVNLNLLDISDTHVANLLPLARNLGLLNELQKNPMRRGLQFANCPVGDLTLREFSKLKNPERTIGTLNYIRDKVCLPPVDGSNLDSKIGSNLAANASVEDLIGSLAQDRHGARPVRIADQFVFAPSGDLADEAVVDESIAIQLHGETIRKLPALSRVQTHKVHHTMAATRHTDARKFLANLS